MLNVGSGVVRIKLRPDEARVVLRYGIWLLRSVRYRPGRLRVSGRYLPFWQMGSKDHPVLYELRMRGRVPGLGRRYLMRCNQSQGSWIVEGLRRWSETATRDLNTRGSGAAFSKARLLKKRRRAGTAPGGQLFISQRSD